MNLCTNKFSRALLGMILLCAGFFLLTSTVEAADSINHHQWMVKADDGISADQLLEMLPTDATLVEASVHWDGNVTIIVFDNERPTADQFRARIEDEVTFGYQAMRAAMTEQLFAERDWQQLEQVFDAITALDDAGRSAEDGGWAIHQVIFNTDEHNVPGVAFRRLQRIEPELDLEGFNLPDRLEADIPSCYGYWHAPSHGALYMSSSWISGSLSWDNASREFTDSDGFEFEIAFRDKNGWGDGYSAYSSSLPCSYPHFDGNQFEVGCGTPQKIKDRSVYSYAFKVKNPNNTPDSRLSLKSQRSYTYFGEHRQCNCSLPGCDLYYKADLTCQTATPSTWKKTYTW